MEYVRLGHSDLQVSRLALGCMSFGDPTTGFAAWSLDDDAAYQVFSTALDLGITFWDTANVYGYGASELVVGRAIRRLTRRDSIVLATKVYFPMGPGSGRAGLSRAAIFEQLDASLERLGTDYIDLYQIHRFDPAVSVEETMSALHEVVQTGKVRYIGACSMHAWQLALMQCAAERHALTSFLTMQHQYSLMQRAAETELLSLLESSEIPSLPWSPLARGRLARSWGSTTRRSDNDPTADRTFDERHRGVAETVERVATRRGTSMAAIALAWLLQRPAVAAPIVGVTSADQLRTAADALAVDLTPAEAEELEAAYPPREPPMFL